MDRVFRHVGAGLNEDVTSFRHVDTAIPRAQVYAIRTFSNACESLCHDLHDLSVMICYSFFRDELGCGSVTPQMARFRVCLVPVGRVLVCRDNQGLGRLAHREITFNNLQGIDE